MESCTQSLCDLALQFGEDDEEGGMVRPYVVSEAGGPVLLVLRIVNGDVCRPGFDHLASWVQSRPFGVALLVAGWDDDGPVL